MSHNRRDYEQLSSSETPGAPTKSSAQPSTEPLSSAASGASATSGPTGSSEDARVALDLPSLSSFSSGYGSIAVSTPSSAVSESVSGALVPGPMVHIPESIDSSGANDPAGPRCPTMQPLRRPSEDEPSDNQPVGDAVESPEDEALLEANSDSEEDQSAEINVETCWNCCVHTCCCAQGYRSYTCALYFCICGAILNLVVLFLIVYALF
jgi:hypothetical protein